MKNGIRTVLLLLGDIVMLSVAFFIMLEISFYGKVSQQNIHTHFLPFMFVFVIWFLVFFLFNLYETQSIKPTIPHLRMIGMASIVALTGSTILFYVVPFFGITPKTNLVIFSVVFVLLFLFWRRIFYNVFSIYFRKEMAFIIEPNKDSACIGEIRNYIETCPQSGFFILGTYVSLEAFRTRQNKTQIDTLTGTPIGKIIRKLHIDEIPQMINILKGDLSLVGPRPERPEFVTQLEHTIPHYKLRHIIRPGFTGWAQIKYRYANTVEDSKEKFQYDLYYIKNRNIFMDFGIILRTIQIIFTH